MKLELLPEPDLEFGSGTHIDIRFGIRDYGPIGFDNPAATKVIKMGFVGTPATIQGVRDWMAEARHGVPEKLSKKPKFRPAFPGFGPESPFRCDWATEGRLERSLQSRDINEVVFSPSHNEGVQKAVHLFIEECRYLDTTSHVDVIVCAPPIDILRRFDNDEEVDEEDEIKTKKSKRAATQYERREASIDLDFHDLLKAKSLTLGSPIQFVRPRTYDESAKEIQRSGRPKSLQDPATRAWNFHTALYYKAGGTPWRLLRRTSELESCYVGISFFRTINKRHIHTSVAQVFNERGEGMILRGAEATMSKDDLQPHLSNEDMKNLAESS